MIQINQTEFLDPVTLATEPVPVGGTIQEQIGWECNVTSGLTFEFAIMGTYGHGTTMENFVGAGFGGIVTRSVPGPFTPADGSWIDRIDVVIPSVPLGVYDCLTMVGFVEGEQFYYFDSRVDTSVITVEAPVGARIINPPLFTRIA